MGLKHCIGVMVGISISTTAFGKRGSRTVYVYVDRRGLLDRPSSREEYCGSSGTMN